MLAYSDEETEKNTRKKEKRIKLELANLMSPVYWQINIDYVTITSEFGDTFEHQAVPDI